MLKVAAPGASTSHSHVYAGVPEVNGIVSMRLVFAPAPVIEGATLIVGGFSAWFMVTRSVAEVALAAGEPSEESVTV